ncbi:MAG: alpha/beta fold hydrolase [Betaproteobacteria bacterium]|nr:alpha/beta fold hydrolase [Betaproteobacteria bacterium]
MNYADVFFTSADGIRLYARDYAGPANDSPAILCLHGLTRNSKDFDNLARHLAPKARVLVPDTRGRGRSARASDLSTYRPEHYVADVLALLDLLDLPAVHLIGTSMGGLMSMMLLGRAPARVRSVIINDIGPQVEPAGLQRIAGYVGQGNIEAGAHDWRAAAENVRRTNADAFPDFGERDWEDMTRNLHVQIDDRVVLDYDPAIARGLADGTAAPDLWKLFEGLAPRPMLVLRGELSDLLSEATVARMRAHSPLVETRVVAKRGHAPTLDEADSRAAIDAFLAAQLAA